MSFIKKRIFSGNNMWKIDKAWTEFLNRCKTCEHYCIAWYSMQKSRIYSTKWKTTMLKHAVKCTCGLTFGTHVLTFLLHQFSPSFPTLWRHESPSGKRVCITCMQPSTHRFASTCACIYARWIAHAFFSLWQKKSTIVTATGGWMLNFVDNLERERA